MCMTNPIPNNNELAMNSSSWRKEGGEKID